MNKEKECPRCCGRGKVAITGRKLMRSNDPAKKWCSHCKTFKDRSIDFYIYKGKAHGYCKPCEKLIVKLKRKIKHDPMGKHSCSMCGKRFNSSKKSVTVCSIECRQKKASLGLKMRFNKFDDEVNTYE